MTDTAARQAGSDGPLTLRTLGAWSASYMSSGQSVTPVLGSSKPLALLVYLALSPGRTASREHLLDLLWADLAPDAASHALRQTAWYIRQRAGVEVLRTTPGSLTLAVPCTVDRDSFLAAIERQDHEQAVAAYAGEFLPGFAAPGGAEFERWADLERDRLRAMFIRAADARCRELLAGSRARDAVALSRRAREAEPSNERGWRLVLESLISAGDAIGAATEADALERMLAGDEREPEPATRALIRAARQTPDGNESSQAGGALVAELVGREQQFGAMLAAWDRVRRGVGAHVHIMGAAGLGKTRLLGDVHQRLRGAGARCLVVRANPGERGILYAFASDLAGALSAQPGALGISSASTAALLALNPSLSSRYTSGHPDPAAGEEALRRRLIAVQELAEAVADEGPFALLIDDLHWIDQASRQIVNSLVARLARTPVLVVTSTRPVADGILNRPDSEHFVLDPLSVASVASLIASLGALPNEPWAGRLANRMHAAAAGSPLLLLETLQLALDRRALNLEHARWSSPDPEALESVLDTGGALRQRVAELDRGQSWVVLVLACAGTAMTTELLHLVIPRPASNLESDLAALEHRGLATRGEQGWLLIHDSVAELAQDLAAPEAIRAAHKSLGSALLDGTDADLTRLVRAGQHLAAAGEERTLARSLLRLQRAARAEGVPRTAAAAARLVLGEMGTEIAVRRLLRHRPPLQRIGLGTPRRIVAAAAVAVAALATTVLATNRAEDTRMLLIALQSDGGSGTRITGVRLEDSLLHGSKAIDIRQGGSVPGLPRVLQQDPDVLLPRPLGTMWVGNGVWNDSDGEDLLLIDGRRSTRMLPAPGDDAEPSWSPDGSFLLSYTDRFDRHNRSDLMIYDFRTGGLRALTRDTLSQDVGGSWSPDGSRIAFARRYYEFEKRPALCWKDFDGTHEACRTLSQWAPTAVSGWAGPWQVYVSAVDSLDRVAILKVDLRNGTASAIAYGDLSGPVVQNRVVCHCRRGNGLSLGIIDLRDTSHFVPIVGGSARAWFLAPPPGASSPFIDSVVVGASPARGIPAGVPSYRFAASGRTRSGDSIDIPYLRWSSSDTTVFTVTDSGLLRPVRPGIAHLTATVGGWRHRTVEVRITPLISDVGAEERWDPSWRSRWRLYGQPRPFVTTGRGGIRGFEVNGDSTYLSGGYTVHGLDVSNGAGLEAAISTPLDRPQWQTVNIGLSSVNDEVAAWDHQTGAAPLWQDSEQYCSWSYGGENYDSWRISFLSTGRESTKVPVSPAMRQGGWWRVRLQIQPDGRCSLSINDKQVATTDARIQLDRPMFVVLEGKSYHTTIMVGPLRTWTGVR